MSSRSSTMPPAKELDRVALAAASAFSAHLRDPENADTWDAFADVMNRLIGLVEKRTGRHA